MFGDLLFSGTSKNKRMLDVVDPDRKLRLSYDQFMCSHMVARGPIFRGLGLPSQVALNPKA